MDDLSRKRLSDLVEETKTEITIDAILAQGMTGVSAGGVTAEAIPPVATAAAAIGAYGVGVFTDTAEESMSRLETAVGGKASE